MPTDVPLQFSQGPGSPSTLALLNVYATQDRKMSDFLCEWHTWFMTFLVSAREEKKKSPALVPDSSDLGMHLDTHTLIKMEIKKFWFEKLRNMDRRIYSPCNLCLKSACMNV